jgi:septin family protein
MPGLRENVVKLNVDYSKVYKFGDSLENQNNFKLVRSNIKDLYKKALKINKLSAISSVASRE